MHAEERTQVGSKKRSKKRRLIWVVVPLVLVAVVVLLVPVFVSSHSGRRLILSKINNSVDGTVDIGALSMSWWKGVKVSDLSFTDQAGQTSVAVRQITSKPHYGSLLFGNLSFGRTDIYEPKVRIKLPEPAPATAKAPRQPAADKPAAVPIVPVSRIDLQVHQGNFKISDAKTQQVEVSKIDSKLALRPAGEQTSFEATMKVAGQAKESNVDVAGQIKPSKASGWSFKGTSGTLTVKVDDLDLGSLGPIFALAGVEIETRGSVSADIKSEIKDGQVQDLVGQVKGKDLDITGQVLRGDQLKSSVLDATIELAQEQQVIDVRKLDLDSDWFNAELGGTMPTSIESLAQLVESDSPYSLNGRFECNLAAAMSQMPQTLGIKEGLKITSGKLTGRVETSTGDAKKRLKGSVNLTGLTGQMGAKKLALSQPVTAEAQVTADEAGVIFEKVDLSASFAKIKLAGSVEKLTYEEQVDLGKLSAELGQFLDMGGYEIGGEVLGKGNVSIAEDKISAAGSGTVKDLSLSSAEGLSVSEPKADIGFSVVVERDRNVLAVDKIEAKTGLGQVSINDAVVPLGEKAAEAMKLNLSASDVDLAKLAPFMVLFASFPKETELAGVAQSQLLVSSRNGTYTFTTDSSKIKNLMLSSPGHEPFVQEEVLFVFDGDYQPDASTWVIRELQLVSPDIEIDFRGEQSVQGNKTKLQGQARLNYDWGAVSAIASPILPPGLTLGGEVNETIDFSSTYPAGEPNQLLANLNTKAKLTFDKGQYMGLNLGATEVPISVDQGVLTIAPFTTTVNNGKLSFAGSADFKQEPTLLTTPEPMQIVENIQVNDQTTRELLMYLNPLFANAVNVSGIANFGCDKLSIPLAKGKQELIEVEGTISLTDLRLQASDLLGQIVSLTGAAPGQSFAIRPTQFVVRDGFVKYDDMQVDIGNNPVNFRGQIGLDSSLNMTVTLPYTLKGLTARADKGSVGKRVELPLKGTLSRPKLDADRLLKDQLIETGLDLLFDKLKKK